MSLINKVLQDLDRRNATPESPAATVPQAALAATQIRPDREWFWRVAALLLAVSVGWVLWVVYQLQPRQVATDSAFRASEWARAAPRIAAAPVAEAAAPTPLAGPGAGSQEAPEIFKLAQEISTTIRYPERTALRKEGQPLDRPQGPGAGAAKTAAVRPATSGKPVPTAPAARLEVDIPPARILASPLPARVEKRDRQRNPAEKAEFEFRRAVLLLNQARVSEAEEGLAAALAADAGHSAARQALIALMVERQRLDEARRLLQEGIAINPAQPQFAAALARIHVERRDFRAALEVAEKGLASAPQDAELHALRGTSLQRLSRHQDAVEAFQAATRAAPRQGTVWLALGISLEALERRPEATEAYRRAVATGTLAPEVRDYAEQRVRQLR